MDRFDYVWTGALIGTVAALAVAVFWPHLIAVAIAFTQVPIWIWLVMAGGALVGGFVGWRLW